MMIEKPEITKLRERLYRTLDNLHAAGAELPEGVTKEKLIRLEEER
jgi:hypothetical protein